MVATLPPRAQELPPGVASNLPPPSFSLPSSVEDGGGAIGRREDGRVASRDHTDWRMESFCAGRSGTTRRGLGRGGEGLWIMAGHHDAQEDPILLYELHATSWHRFYTDQSTALASYTCAMALGYDTIANGASNAMPAFSLYFGHFDPIKHVPYLDSIWISLWGSMSGLGQVLGALVAGPLSQTFGRRYVGMAFGAVSVLASHEDILVPNANRYI